MTSNRLETDEKAERSKPGRPFDETPVIFENREDKFTRLDLNFINIPRYLAGRRRVEIRI